MPFISSVAGTTGYGRSQVATNQSSDKIAASLTTSLAAYNAAASGSWIKITASEYANLLINVASTTIIGANDAIVNINSGSSFVGGNFNVANLVTASTPAVPVNSYIYAFKIRMLNSRSDLRVIANKSTSTYTGFVIQGGILPTTTASAINYYVLKGVSSTNGATQGLLGFYSGSGVDQIFCSQVGLSVQFIDRAGVPTTSTNLNRNNTNIAFCYQGLTTTIQQW